MPVGRVPATWLHKPCSFQGLAHGMRFTCQEGGGVGEVEGRQRHSGMTGETLGRLLQFEGRAFATTASLAIMVATVIPYFQKWVAKWPTVSDLAAASIEDVNSMWAGLGYYRRARYLLDGAKYVVEKLDCNFPATAKELLQRGLPMGGMGAGADCVWICVDEEGLHFRREVVLTGRDAFR
eukprot:364469-Chlamydomonas_euryale.AAC.11